jgi:aryl-alcohol dehydrogenase-like predicted oxidoreductase
MKRRRLGAKGFEVSEVGLGCWQLGGDFGPLSEATAMEIMAEAVRQGITFLDTANVYGDGRSESLIGRFLSQAEHDIRIATKFGRGDVFPDRYSEDALRRSAEASRERLGVETLDLLQLHCVPTEVLKRGEIFDWLRRLRDAGTIRHFGASVESDQQAMLCLGQDGLLSLQIIFNIFRQKPLDELLPRAAEQGVGLIVRLPLASGLLTGKFRTDTRFDETDHRSFNRDGQAFNVGETFAGLPFERGVELAERLQAWVPEGMTMAQLAQRWILDHEAVSTIITGASSKAQVADNAAVSTLPPLPDDLHRKLADFYHREVAEQIRGPY